MFNCPASHLSCLIFLRDLNRIFGRRGLRLVPLRETDHSILLYLYRPAMLERDLNDPLAARALCGLGYPAPNAARCVAKLAERMRDAGDFPHEVGYFLGYPPVDVWCYSRDHRRCPRCSGTWKVYHDVKGSREKFRAYRHCRCCFQEAYRRNKSLESLIVSEMPGAFY